MKNKIKSLLLSGTILATSVVYAAPEKPEAEKTKVEAIQDVAKQPGMFERGTKCVTSAVRTGVNYLTQGVLLPVRAVGNLVEYAGVEAGKAVALAGDDMGIPVIGEYAGSITRAPADLIFMTLDTSGNLVQGAINHTTNIMMTGIDSVATLPRSPKEAGRDFSDSIKAVASYDCENPGLNVFRFSSFVYTTGVGLTLKGAYSVVEGKDVLVRGFNKKNTETFDNSASFNTELEIILLQQELNKSQIQLPEKVSSKKTEIPASVVLMENQKSR